MGDLLLFDPKTEFQVLEEFEYDELIQRPEEVRFYTLGEQTTDLTNKLLPKTGKLSKAAIQRVEYEVDSFTQLYHSILAETPDGFEQVANRRPVTLPWVNYANKSQSSTTLYIWETKWLPLYSQDTGMFPNYYTRLLDSLPKSAIYYPDGNPAVVYPAIVNGTTALGAFKYTKTAYREDGTFRIQSIERPDTQDVATFTGYTLDVPPLAPPTPLEGHPFLGLREAPVTIETDEPLPIVLPSVEAILQHAVPRTTNPYKDATPYLKVYDVKLSSIPWIYWKESFPPVDLIEQSAPPLDIPVKESEEHKPSQLLLDIYKTPWHDGLSSRKWLSEQLDSGVLVPKILLSHMGNLGPIAVPPPVILPPPVPIVGTVEDCLPTYITDYNDFASRGVYRTPKCFVCGWFGHGATLCPDRKGPVTQEYKPGGGCIPLAQIASEREDIPFAGRQPWVPGTDATIINQYKELIGKYSDIHTDFTEKPPEADPSTALSETRKLIVAILGDDERTSEDKAIDIRVLLDDTEHTIEKKLYKETETTQFLLCCHTLSYLDGEFERDANVYYQKWSVTENGYKVCRYCGEKLEHIVEDQAQFDEHGNVINQKTKLPTTVFHAEENISFASSLQKMQKLFNTDSPAEDIFYLLLSLLQVLPDETQLNPILGFIRGETAKVNSKIAGKTLTAKQKGDISVALSLFGFNGFVVLLQTHRPQLLPRRTFGSRPIILRGFPRDTEDTADAPLVDALLNALFSTFESYPTTFKGSSVVFLRNILNDKKAVRKLVLSSMTKQFVPQFKQILLQSKDLQQVEVVQPSNVFQPPIVQLKKDTSFLKPSEAISDAPETRYRCKDLILPWLIPSTPFSFRQEQIGITVPLKPSAKARLVPFPTNLPVDFDPPVASIREKIKRKVPDFKPLKTALEYDSPQLLEVILLEWMSLLAGSKTAPSALKTYVRKTRPEVEHSYTSGATLRDYFKGLLVELVTMLGTDQTLLSILERASKEDLTLRSISTKAEEAKKVADTLRAREREEFKERMRRLPDDQRELTKALIDRGLYAYLITREDRQMFLNQMEEKPPQPEEVEEVEEGGIDIGAQGEVPVVGDTELPYDAGDYGDNRARTADGEEFQENVAFNEDEGYGY